jgi:tetratricopeptide (TPR) repeat protein
MKCDEYLEWYNSVALPPEHISVNTMPDLDDNCPPLETLPSAQRHALLAAGFLGSFDAAALAALLDDPVDPFLNALEAAGLIHQSSEMYRIAPLYEAAIRRELDDLPGSTMRAFAERATRYYAQQIDGTNDAEHAYMRHFVQLCDLLIQQEPGALVGVAASASFFHFNDQQHQHTLAYYRGLGEGLLDRFDVAQTYFEALLAAPDLDDTTKARTLNSSALFAQSQGEYERARDRFAAGYAIWQRLGNSVRQGSTLKNMGILHYELHEYDAAEAKFRESAALFESAGATYFQALSFNELGLLCRERGRWRDAETYLQQAAVILAQEGSQDFQGRIANNLGEVALLQGRLDDALAHFEAALKLMTSQMYAIDVHLNRGLIYQAVGDAAQALAEYQTALELVERIGRNDVAPLIHYRIGRVQQQLGRNEAAYAAYIEAADAIEARREPMRDEALLMSLMGRWQQVYEAAILCCLEQNDAVGAFSFAERARARAFADLLAQRGADLVSEQVEPVTAPEIQAALTTGTLLLSYFTIGLRGPEAALLDAMPPAASAVRACLEIPPQLVLLALSQGAARIYTCPLDPNVLHAASPYLADGRRFLRPAIVRRISDALIAPAINLVAHAQRIIVVPHGPLHHCSFAALCGPTGEPLIDQVSISYAPSATTWLRTVATSRDDSLLPCLALGYDSADAVQLRHTEAEAKAIAQSCGGIAWRGAKGVSERLAREAGRYRRLHLACHGEYDVDDPLNSWLELGPGERLRAAAVIAEFTLHADLVTLSACRSGVSRILRGDEPMGLVRAFLRAGAQAVLVTLWPVEDQSARLLMERFYAILLAQGGSADPAAALRDAQRYLRDLRDDAGTHPYVGAEFWAPYVLVGGAAITST